jgi:hypothetical protein
LKETDGKVLNCAAIASKPNSCSFDRQVLGVKDEATFTLSGKDLTRGAIVNNLYFNYNDYMTSTLFYCIPSSLFNFFPNVINMYFSYLME